MTIAGQAEFSGFAFMANLDSFDAPLQLCIRDRSTAIGRQFVLKTHEHSNSPFL